MSKKLKLTDREWREFQFKDVFYIVDGYYNKKPPMEENGTLPFLGATQYNNGVTGMTSKDNVRLRDKVGGNSINDVEKRFYAGGGIAVTNNGSVGHAYYQSGEFTCSHDITVIYLKDQAMSKELATFLIPSIQKAGESFAYAKKWRPIRMRRSKLMLPIQEDDGTPDWAFMEVYMKQVEEELLSRVRPKLEEQLLEHIISLGALEDREWSEFVLTDFFNPIKGNQNNMASLIDGELPLISAKKGDNGVKAFVSPNKKSLFPRHCITLNLDGDGGAGLAFYQEYSFALDSHVVALYPKFSLDKFCLLFIARSISAQRSRFGHGRAINKSRLNHFLLMLPIQADGTPDWEFMSAFMKKVEQDTLSKALLHFSLRKSEQMLIGRVK